MKIVAIGLVIGILLAGLVYGQGLDFGKIKMGQHIATEELVTERVTGASAMCGVKLFLPSGWSIAKDEPNRLDASGPQGMWLAIVMNDYDEEFPVEASLQAYMESAKKEKGVGKLIDWQERVIDGVKGVQRVEALMPDPSDPRRITWVGYRGTVGINIVASSKSKDFDSCFPTLNQVIGSIKW